jgi:hypothetical protein
MSLFPGRLYLPNLQFSRPYVRWFMSNGLCSCSRYALATLGLTLALLCGRNAFATTYLDYYRSIAKAEEAVVKGQYLDAIKQYAASFAAHPYSSPTDCYVAAQVASYLGDRESCTSFLRRGLCSGLPLHTIRGNPHLASFITGGHGNGLSSATVDSCWQVYQGRIDKKARATMIGLIRRDQSFIHGLPRSESIYDRDGFTLKPAYRPLWDSLLHEIIRLTKESGFPAQKVIGTQTGDDSVLAVRPLSLYAYFILVHHGNAWPQLSDVLWGELEKGNITPQLYGAIADNSDRRVGMIHRYMAVRDCEASTKPRECRESLRGRLVELNAARSEIGLCSYEVMQKKRECTMAYYKWRNKKSRAKEAVFDFQSDFHFQG